MATPLWNIFTIIGTEAMSFKTLMNTLANSVEAGISKVENSASPTVANVAARAVRFPSPVQGNSVFRTDVGFEERYYGLYNATTNPGGRAVADWYPNSPISVSYTYALKNMPDNAVTILDSATTVNTDLTSTGASNTFSINGTNRLVFRNAGMYSFGGYVAMQLAGGTRNLAIVILRNAAGTEILASRAFFGPLENAGTATSPGTIRVTQPGSYLEVSIYQSSGTLRAGTGAVWASYEGPLV